MSKKEVEDLTGKQFGRWIVLGRAEDRLSKNGIFYRYWLCQCNCEKKTIREVREYSLINETSTSCGCLSKDTYNKNHEEKEVIPDLIGKIFGEWTVLSLSEKVNGSRYWNCLCSCGTNRAIPERHLLLGHSKSCGHVKDLIGQRFGRLVVVNREENKILSNGKTSAMWLCKCDCGKETIVEGRLLKSGTTKSCGCLQYETYCKNLNQKQYNEYDLSGEYGIGYTSNLNQNGLNEFYFDLENYDRIKNYCWYFSSNKDKYLIAKDENHNTIYFHKLIIDTDLQVDHIQHKTYDNRKSQLRIATNQENCRNQGVQSNNTSGVTGVSWNEKLNKWQAYIGINNKCIYLGVYSNINDAIKVRKNAEEEYFGEWSYTNSVNYTI